MTGKISVGRDARNKTKPHIVRWYGDFDPHAGKQRRYSKSFRLKVEAEQFAAEQTVKFTKGTQRDRPENVTVKNFCKDWLKTQGKIRKFRPGTVQLYQHTVDRLISHFGPDILLSQISIRMADDFQANLMPMRGEDLSNWTIARTLRHCKTIFDTAVDYELIVNNPFKRVKAPKCITHPWYYLKPDEYHNLLEVAPTLRWKALYALTYTCGLRKGEAFNLTWGNIDFETSQVRIDNRAATVKMPPFYVKDYQPRTIPLPKHTLGILLTLHSEAPEKIPFVLLGEPQYRTALAKWRSYQEQVRPWRNEDLINNSLRDFNRHLRRAEIKPDADFSIHTLRKCCIQNWANNITNPEVVRVLAGHSSLATTMKFYSQADADSMVRAAQSIDALLKKADVKMTYEGNLG